MTSSQERARPGEDVLGGLSVSLEEYEDLKEYLLLQLGQRA